MYQIYDMSFTINDNIARKFFDNPELLEIIGYQYN